MYPACVRSFASSVCRTLSRRALALSDLQKRSGQDAHHILQEARAVVIEINIVFPPDDLDGIDDPHGGFFHLRVRAEAFVVMLAGEILCCALHGGKIGLVIEHGDVFAVKDRLRIADVAGVGVELADGAVARVEAVGGELRLLHADIVRKVPIHVVADLFGRFLRVHVGVGRHGPCMDACVRAGRAR